MALLGELLDFRNDSFEVKASDTSRAVKDRAYIVDQGFGKEVVPTTHHTLP